MTSSTWPLVPARFLCLTAHLIGAVALLWSRRDNVVSGLPLEHTPDDYDAVDLRFTVALSVTLACLVIEFGGFFSGITMFQPVTATISTALHMSTCVAMAFFAWDEWPSDEFWWLVVLGAALPAAVELLAVAKVLACGKRL